MGKSKYIIMFITLLLVVHAAVASLNWWPAFNWIVFMISPILIIYMVISVLKDTSQPDELTFEDRFYHDLDYTPIPSKQ